MRELTLTEINQISGGDTEDQIIAGSILIVVIFIGIAVCTIYVCH